MSVWSNARVLLLALGAWAVPARCAEDDLPASAAGEECLISDHCAGALRCVDGYCQSPDVGAGGTGAEETSGVEDAGGWAGISNTVLDGLAGGAGVSRELACGELCNAGLECPGVESEYDCAVSCDATATVVEGTGCHVEWSHVLRCLAVRGPCAACDAEVKQLHACVARHCEKQRGAVYCALF